MKRKKKSLFILGSILNIAIPITTVISCSSDNFQEETLKLYDKYKTNSAESAFESIWRDALIQDLEIGIDLDNLYNNNNFNIVAKTFLENKIQEDGNYINFTFSQHLLSMTKPDGTLKYTKQDLKDHFMITDLENEIPSNIKLAVDYTIQVINNEIIFESIKNEILKLLIVFKYLGTTKRQFSNINDEYNFNDLENSFEEDQYLLVNEAMNQKIFLNWEIKKLDPSNNEIVNMEIANMDYKTNNFLKKDLDALLIDGGPLTTKKNQINLENVEKNIDNNYSDLMETKKFNDLKSYKFYSGNDAPMGKGILDLPKKVSMDTYSNYYKDELDEYASKNQVDLMDMWNGYIYDGEIIKKEIKTLNLKKGLTSISIHKVFGVMPIYKNSTLTFNGSYFENNKKQLRAFLSLRNISLFSEAVSFYNNAKQDNYFKNNQIVINDNNLYSYYEDKGVYWLKKRDN
ncbi:MAG: hypothetical protein K4H23_05365 [Mollicutes bacterium PWAP]|nr:hypothetical protein [Mollicutes bacterium PWAP]